MVEARCWRVLGLRPSRLAHHGRALDMPGLLAGGVRMTYVVKPGGEQEYTTPEAASEVVERFIAMGFQAFAFRRDRE